MDYPQRWAIFSQIYNNKQFFFAHNVPSKAQSMFGNRDLSRETQHLDDLQQMYQSYQNKLNKNYWLAIINININFRAICAGKVGLMKMLKNWLWFVIYGILLNLKRLMLLRVKAANLLFLFLCGDFSLEIKFAKMISQEILLRRSKINSRHGVTLALSISQKKKTTHENTKVRTNIP